MFPPGKKIVEFEGQIVTGDLAKPAKISSSGIGTLFEFEWQMSKMEAVVFFEGAEATYHITPENESMNIYQAQLSDYEGGDVFSPPKMLILIKGGDKWWGGGEHVDIVEALGKAIDLKSDEG